MAGHGHAEASDGNCAGLYELAAHDVAAWARQRHVGIGVSFFEVYRGHVADLLGERVRLDVLEDGRGRVQLPGLREVRIEEAGELLSLVRQAEELRAVGCTSANEQSSRSHAILQVVLRDRMDGHAVGKLSLVDLAGSERAADASSKDRQTRIEGAEINKSLLCLKECIRSLDSGSSHTPFRGSKLTKVLRDSFVGRAKTVMIATVSPGSSAAENTLNTLRYAQRVKDFSAKRAPPTAGGNGGGGVPDRRASGAMPPAQPAWSAAGPVSQGGAPIRVAGAPSLKERTAPSSAPVDDAVGGSTADLGATRRFSEGAWSPSDETGAGGGAVGGASDAAPGSAGVESAGAATPSSSRRVAAAEEAAIEELSASLKPANRGGGEEDEVGSFFKSVAAVSRAEEVLIAQHKEAIEASEMLLQQEKLMLDDLREADGCSVDEYAAALEKVLGAKLRICSELTNRLDALKETIANEEALSARVRQVPLY